MGLNNLESKSRPQDRQSAPNGTAIDLLKAERIKEYNRQVNKEIGQVIRIR